MASTHRLLVALLGFFCFIRCAEADIFTFFDSTDTLTVGQALDPGNTFFLEIVDFSGTGCKTTVTVESCSLKVFSAGFGGSALAMSAPFTPFFVDIVDPHGTLSDRIFYTPSSTPGGAYTIAFQSDSDITPLTPLPGASATITENGDIQTAFTVTWTFTDPSTGKLFIENSDTIQFQSDLDAGTG